MFPEKRTVFSDKNDVLGRHAGLATLRRVLRTIHAPACVALYGAWGVGKTSLLRSAYEQWEEGPRVWFDPWEHEGQKDVLSPLLLALARARGEPALPEKIKRLSLGILKVLSRVSLGVGVKTVLGRDVDLDFDDLSGEAIAKAFEPIARHHDEAAKVKKEFADLVLALTNDDPRQRVAVFLDDLDRCLPETVVTLIESVKLLLCDRDSNANVVFVFAVDRRVVGEAIRHRYGGISTYTGENYLEKIFDFSIEVPPLGKTAVRGLITKLKADEPRIAPWLDPIYANLEPILQSPAFANPRVVKRVLNRFWQLWNTEEHRKPFLSLSAPEQLLFVIWTAGAERYRLFRQFFCEAPLRELVLLNAFLTGEAPGTENVPLHVQQIAGLPDFLSYYQMLDLHSATTADGQRVRRAQLLRLDAMLRMQGL